jgi:hypothetical protein
VLYLSPTQPAPAMVPFELQNYISPEIWEARIPSIARVTSRYSKPLFEGVWALLGFFFMTIVPVAIFKVVLVKNSGLRHSEARAISFGIFVTIALIFFLPVAIWKFMGRKEVNTMLMAWAETDRMTSGQHTAIPIWKVKFPGVFRDTIALTIVIPPNKSPSAFHPDAYLPSYINRPIDPDSYYYPYRGGSGLPHMSIVGDVYVDEKRGLHVARV